MKLNLKKSTKYICYLLDLPKNSSDNIITFFDENTHIKIFNTSSSSKLESLKFTSKILYPNNKSIIKYFEMPCDESDQSLFFILQLSHSYKRISNRKIILISNIYYSPNEIVTGLNLDPYHHNFLKSFRKQPELDEVINCYRRLNND